MGFFQDLGADIACAFTSCPAAVPPYNSIIQNFSSRINVACSAVAVNVQNVLCPVVVEKCSNVNINCGNKAIQTVECSLDQLVQAATDTAIAADPERAADGLGLQTQYTRQEIESRMASVINQKCGGSAQNIQDITSNLMCKYSNNVNLNAITNLDQKHACVAMAVVDLLSEGSQKDTGSAGKGASWAIIATIFVVYIGILIGIVFAIRGRNPKINSSKV